MSATAKLHLKWSNGWRARCGILLNETNEPRRVFDVESFLLSPEPGRCKGCSRSVASDNNDAHDGARATVTVYRDAKAVAVCGGSRKAAPVGVLGVWVKLDKRLLGRDYLCCNRDGKGFLVHRLEESDSLVAQTVSCRTCGARKGSPCHTGFGRPPGPHANRLRAAIEVCS